MIFKCCKVTVDKKMLPMKLHFFFYALALGSVFLYFSLIAKNIGISVTGVGITFTIVPFVTVLINPIFGCITDKFKKIKFFIMLLAILQTPIYFSINYIPEIEKEKHVFSDVKFLCNNDNDSMFIESAKFLTINPSNKTLECNFECMPCNNSDMLCHRSFNIFSKSPINNSKIMQVINTTLEDNATSSICYEEWKENCWATCFMDEEDSNSFLHYQFWLFVFLTASGIIVTDIIIALSDVACYESLEGRVNQFGKQRMWLSIGWGVISACTGYIVELANMNNKGKTDFSVCFYMMLPLMLLDVIILGFTDMKKDKSSSHILRDVRKIFVKPHPYFIVLAVFLVGAFAGIQWNFAFWYFDEMGASKILMGVSSATICMFSEVPFMFTSGWIIKRIGRDNCMCLAFIAYSIWFLTASYIYNAWWIILPDLTQGPCYGLFYAAMSSYGKIIAAPGTEATMQAILRASFFGLGVGSGSLLGGIGFEKYGGRMTYRFTGFFTLGAAVVYKFITVFIAGENSVIGDKKEETEDKPKLEDLSTCK
ncbi:major facilitator superfamily domain-containing protein 6-A-like [Centruroides vittatus]|uniref:major facilitator superfamily domain-containing protein 6-A-like n=1 Tax=Centruroides vittatus TaxID=120091 RepID=UPI00350F6F45